MNAPADNGPTDPKPKNRDIYSATMKLFGSQPEPAFDHPDRMKTVWGREWGCDNDVGQIRTVMVHRPGPEFGVIDPSKYIEETGGFGDVETGWYWQSEEIPPLEEMQTQHDGMVQVLKDEGIEVVYLEGVEGNRFKSCYTRDSSFAVKGGAIVNRLAPRLRHGEERDVSRTLAKLGMPILATITGTGMLEGGSFAWLNSKTAVVGRGIRVNDEAIEQLSDALRRQGVDLLVVDLPGYSIHIDGHFVMVDVDLALVDPRGLSYTFLQKLKDLGIRTVEITPEDNSWIINGLALRPGKYLMPYGISNRTRDELMHQGLELIEIPYDKMQLNGGGIHCSTCPLIRDRV
ncbi:MAG: arginine deiminase family protein [Alphaproteobacteria bacterium]